MTATWCAKFINAGPPREGGRRITGSCFSGDCGFCSGCSGDAGTKVVEYLSHNEFYKMNTGEDPPKELEQKNPRALWQKMMYYSDLYRIRVDCGTWGRFVRRLRIRQKIQRQNQIMYKPDGIFWEIRGSHIEFLKGCTEEGVVYGEKRCLKPDTNDIESIIGGRGGVDINAIAGKVVIRGGGLFDIDARKKQMNLKNEDYEEYFDKFQTYLIKVNERLKEYGVSLGEDYRGKVPEFINVGDKKYVFWDDDRVMCDDPECSLMGHCMIHWDENSNYTGSNPPEYNSYYYGSVIASIPKYTHNKKHELCLTCALKASKVR
jgi:hypothetical protein